MRVLVHVSDSAESAEAARLAGEIARHSGAGVTLLSVSPSFDKRLRAFQLAELALPPQIPVERRTSAGLVESVLPRIANEERFDLVVLARHGGLDAITSRLLMPPMIRQMRTNTLIVRGKRRPLERILCCSSGAPSRLETVRASVDLARWMNVPVTVLHVLSQMPLESEGTADIEQLLAAEHPAAETLHEARRLIEPIPGALVRLRVGLVVEEIRQEAHEGAYSLFVAGAHGGAREDWLTQNITEYLVNHVPASMLIVHGWPVSPSLQAS